MEAKALLARGVNVISFGAGEPDLTHDYIKDAAVTAIYKENQVYR